MSRLAVLSIIALVLSACVSDRGPSYYRDGYYRGGYYGYNDGYYGSRYGYNDGYYGRRYRYKDGYRYRDRYSSYRPYRGYYYDPGPVEGP